MSDGGRDTAVLRPSKARWLATVAVSALLVGLALLLVRTHPLGGWACVALFGLSCAVGVLNLLPGASRLELDDEGFEIVSLFRHTRVRWADVARFGRSSVGVRHTVGFDFVDGYRGSERLRRVNRGLSGFQAALPDTYGLKADALAGRMNARLAAWREAAARR